MESKKQIRKGSHSNPKTIVIYQKPDQWSYSDGVHPPIIGVELFARAQEILAGRRHPPYNKGVLENALAGLVKCGRCGSSMQRRISGSTSRRPYLICPHTGCIQAVQHAFVEKAVLDLLHDRMHELHVELQAQEPQDTSVLEQALQSVHKELTLIEKQKARLHDLLEQGVYSIETFHARLSALEERGSALELQQETQGEAIARLTRHVRETAFERITSVSEAYSAADAQARNTMLKSVIKEVVYEKTDKSKPQAFSLYVRLREF